MTEKQALAWGFQGLTGELRCPDGCLDWSAIRDWAEVRIPTWEDYTTYGLECPKCGVTYEEVDVRLLNNEVRVYNG